MCVAGFCVILRARRPVIQFVRSSVRHIDAAAAQGSAGTMSRLSSRIAQAFAVSIAVVAVVAACGSEGGSNFDPSTSGGTSNGSTGASNGSTGQTSGVFNTSGTTGASGDGGTSGASGTSGDIDPSCVPLTCAAQGLGCGLAGDGCGGKSTAVGARRTSVAVARASPPSACGSTAVPNLCTPKDCRPQGIKCGQAGDGCGNTITCGTCAADEQCGGLASPLECVEAHRDGGRRRRVRPEDGGKLRHRRAGQGGR